MSIDPTTDLSTMVEELRDRVRRLEDIEALRNLKAEYARRLRRQLRRRPAGCIVC